jgi:hypothetical protein
MNFIQSIYLTHFSKPDENRNVYQAVVRLKPVRILEFGIQRGIRTINILELAKRYHRTDEIDYICVDPFESRTLEDGPGLSLRKTHKILTCSEIRSRMIPGSPEKSVAQIARLFNNIDLIVIATPSLDWITTFKKILAGLMNERGMFFLGQSAPNGQPFELYPYTVDQLRHFDSFRRVV